MRTQKADTRISMNLKPMLAVACLGASACTQLPPAEGASARVLVRFHQATPGAAPEVLAGLAQVSGAAVRHAAAVSDREHAYVLDCPPADPQCAGALQALRSWTARLERVDPDEVKRFKR